MNPAHESRPVSGRMYPASKKNKNRELPRVRRSYSYRYLISEANDAPSDLVSPGCSIIETRYRGRNASWKIASFTIGAEPVEVGGTFIAPQPDNLLAYPPNVLAKAPEHVPTVSADFAASPAPAASAAPLQLVPDAPPAAVRAPARRPPPPTEKIAIGQLGLIRVREETQSESDAKLVAFQRALQYGEFDPVVS